MKKIISFNSKEKTFKRDMFFDYLNDESFRSYISEFLIRKYFHFSKDAKMIQEEDLPLIRQIIKNIKNIPKNKYSLCDKIYLEKLENIIKEYSFIDKELIKLKDLISEQI